MASPVTRTEVNIFGSTYSISGETDPEYVRRLASFIDNKMRELSASLPSASVQKLAILAALNIADEFFQFKELNTEDDISRLYEMKTKKLISMLDEGLIGDIY
ncbi:MAG TPA: cell division protein ZapA [Leptospiraceae bacterium]|nr:cell division protein ZapA [Leptospiraceae bacterium]HMW04979.1 cell division protein ZapA [Leptospiraceae bacterium]HMX33870.1 cell division protein ZapA [Leptospiraceae bacterium]HMY30800.1 cell division protein ZapA [Leptospiraceae bacterium]HMZ64261.1 cell division protein ZapA [Leptospiraceae bacterium]